MDLHSLFPSTTYCERGTDTGLFAEPVTAIANIAILVSAFYMYKLLRDDNSIVFPYLLLPLLMLITGLGSLLWHIYPNYITLVLDSLPVVLFLLTVLFIYFYKLFGTYTISLIGVAGLLAVNTLPILIFPELFPDATARNILALAIFLLILAFSYFRVGRYALRLILPTSLFIIAMVFREVDTLVCQYIPIGTHFLWHIFNSIAAYFFVYFVVNLRPSQT